MERIEAELQDSVVDLTRQLTELQARHDSTRNQLQTRMQALDQRELRVKSEAETVRKKWEMLEMRELEREEHLVMLEKSVEERERGLDGMHKSLEEQRRHSKALQEKLGLVSGQMRVRLREFEEKAREVGLKVSGCGDDEGGGGGCEMRGGLNAGEVVKLIGEISRSAEIVELCQGVDCVDKMQDVIRILIERKQLIEAVEFICTFKFTDEFPPVALLNEYVEDAEKWWTETFSQKKSLRKKENAVDDRITSLRAVAQCVKAYNLQSEYSLVHIDNDILELENLKENLHSVASLNIMMKTKGFGKLNENREVVLCLPSYNRQEQRNQRKEDFSTLSPSFRIHRCCRKKINRPAISTASPMTRIED